MDFNEYGNVDSNLKDVIPEEKMDEFEDTVLWANEEEKTRKPVENRIPSIYLIAIALFILVIVFFIIIKFSKAKENQSALSLIQDDDNMISNASDLEIEISDDEIDKMEEIDNKIDNKNIKQISEEKEEDLQTEPRPKVNLPSK